MNKTVLPETIGEWRKLTREELKSCRKNGYFEGENDGDVYEVAPTVAQYKAVNDQKYGCYDHSVAVRQIFEGCIYEDRLLTSIAPNNPPTFYAVERMICCREYTAETKYFTDLTDAIDEYNKIKSFLKDNK